MGRGAAHARDRLGLSDRRVAPRRGAAAAERGDRQAGHASGVKVLGIVGWSGSGKTTLLTALMPLLTARGLSVSTVKHTHHGFDMDRPGKDTYRHREAGAHEVLVASEHRWALLHEGAGEDWTLELLLARLQPVDLVLVEGFKTDPCPEARSAPARARQAADLARSDRYRRGGHRRAARGLRPAGAAARPPGCNRHMGDRNVGVRNPWRTGRLSAQPAAGTFPRTMPPAVGLRPAR